VTAGMAQRLGVAWQRIAAGSVLKGREGLCRTGLHKAGLDRPSFAAAGFRWFCAAADGASLRNAPQPVPPGSERGADGAGRTSSTRNQTEMAKFDGLDWEGSEGRELAKMHVTRMGAVCEYLKTTHGLTDLRGIRVADVGCGGGLLSASLVELGASVVAIDPVQSNVDVTSARVARHQGASSNAGTFEGRACTVEELLQDEGHASFDFVLSLEVIEHVNEQALFLESCSKLCSQGLILSTLNRTPESYALAILGAEYVTGMVPPGTHDWFMFVVPSEIEDVIHANGLHTDEVTGLVYNPLSDSWSTSAWNTGVNYMLFASR